MTAAAAIPVAARRLARAAAGRRALQLLLFLGGLLTLGLLFGGPAYAVDAGVGGVGGGAVGGVGTATASAPAVDPAPAPASAGADSTAEGDGSAEAGAPRALPSVTRTAPVPRTAPASGTATVPGTATQEGATPEARNPGANPLVLPARVADGAEQVAEVLPEAALPEVLPEALPAVLPDVLPEPRLAGAEVAGVVPGGAPSPDLDGLAPGEGLLAAAGAADVPNASQPGAGSGSGAAYYRMDRRFDGVSPGGARGPAEPAGVAARHPAVPLPWAPMPRQVFGLAVQSASDGSGQRHGDAQGVASCGGTAVRLLPGEGASAVYYPVRDRHRDILEFPG